MPEKEKIQEVPVKMYRTSNRLTVAAPMPGMEPEDILIQIAPNGRLVIQGEMRAILKDIKELLADEWSVGAYYRELELPNAVDGQSANVTYGNGVLVVAMPLSEQIVPATLILDKIGIARGEYVGNAGHPPM